MPSLTLRRRPAAAPARTYQIGVDVIPVGQVQQRERLAAEQARREVADQTARAMAAAVVGRVRCSLTVEDVLPVCELADTIVRMAAANGVYVEPPRLADLAKVCEDLATRNVRRGYSAMVPIGPLTGCLFGSYSPGGRDFGYDDGEVSYLGKVSAALPGDHRERLHALQHPGEDRARTMLAELDAAGADRYVS